MWLLLLLLRAWALPWAVFVFACVTATQDTNVRLQAVVVHAAAVALEAFILFGASQEEYTDRCCAALVNDLRAGVDTPANCGVRVLVGMLVVVATALQLTGLVGRTRSEWELLSSGLWTGFVGLRVFHIHRNTAKWQGWPFEEQSEGSKEESRVNAIYATSTLFRWQVPALGNRFDDDDEE